MCLIRTRKAIYQFLQCLALGALLGKIIVTLQNLKTEFDNYRLRSEYSLQRMLAENKALLEALGSRNCTIGKSESSPSSAEFPVSTTSPELCSSCEDIFWSDKSFDGSVFNLDGNSQETGDNNSHMFFDSEDIE